MSERKFKVGDKVLYYGEEWDGVRRGDIGTVSGTDGNREVYLTFNHLEDYSDPSAPFVAIIDEVAHAFPSHNRGSRRWTVTLVG